MTDAPLRVLVVDDQAPFRTAIRRVLGRAARFDVIGEASDGAEAVTLYPYALISRHGKPEILGYYILHEGLIGVLGDKGPQEVSYSKIESEKQISFAGVVNSWLGITDKYWAATLLPETNIPVRSRAITNTVFLTI